MPWAIKLSQKLIDPKTEYLGLHRHHMKKIISAFQNGLTAILQKLDYWILKSEMPGDQTHKFVDLAPTDEADEKGIYSEALFLATRSQKVSNIALTGPYGSGKSSIIQSFLKKYQRPALHISLAAFVSEANSDKASISRQEIERSILQQMLYGADANKLPLSRFKRIQSPGFGALLKSLWIMVGLLSLWYLLQRKDDIITGEFFTPYDFSNWFSFSAFSLSIIFLWGVIHHFYILSFGLSLKGISLKNVEIKPANEDETSILNRHLDEIIYFFQSTKYDLVVIEDLDRFNDADIFVNLREINSLINGNAGVNRKVRFLYALRDDMFANTERTKFFEFIVPVIPIINSSNSIDMVLKQGQRLDLNNRLDHQFLREVSRYLNDLRLIQNIFNEYSIYVSNLENEGDELLDANKLLSVLIYKNVYPRDFEQLHRGEGILSKILKLKEEIIQPIELKYKGQINEIEDAIREAEKQTPLDLNELQAIYTGAIFEKTPPHIYQIIIGNNPIHFNYQSIKNNIDKIANTKDIKLRFNNGSHQSFIYPDIEKEVHSQKSYNRRKEDIELKSEEIKSKKLQDLLRIKSKLSTIRTTKINELLRLHPDRSQEYFEEFPQNGELARYLVLEGYLDDTYYLYTSLFHSGRLSPNDNKFLIKIRAFITPEPDFPIDNPKEVIAAMRREDFSQSYVLNVKIVNILLENQIEYVSKYQDMLLFISSNFEDAESFFDAFYSSGSNISEILLGLSKSWEDFVPSVLSSSNNISHVSKIISNLPEILLEELVDKNECLSEFVAENLPEILSIAGQLPPEILESLYFKVRDLEKIKKHSEVVNFMVDKGLFEITIPNFEFIYQEVFGKADIEVFREKNLTIIKSLENKALYKRIESDFELYFKNIILKLENNNKEDLPAILQIIQNETINIEEISSFLERQNKSIPSLKDVPKRLHDLLFKLKKVEPSWLNCLTFMQSENFEKDSLINYLNKDGICKSILENPIPIDDDYSKLRRFLIHANALSNNNYRKYVHALPKAFKAPPESVEPGKLSILIEEQKITFSPESFRNLTEHRILQVKLLKSNIKSYLESPDDFLVDDSFKEDILATDLNDSEKIEVIKLMDLNNIYDYPDRSAIIGPIINRVETPIKLDGRNAESVIINSDPIAIKISLFNKYHSFMSDREIRRVLDQLPKPYSDIKTGYNTPRLKNTPENQELVKWLDSKGFISSWRNGDFFSDDIRINLYRKND